MNISINKHYDFIFDTESIHEQHPFSLWNGIYLVERALVYADMVVEGIDIFESLYAPIGKGNQEFETTIDGYLDSVFYKLVSPNNNTSFWVPEDIVVGYPNPNVKQYHAVMVTADMGLHDNPEGVLAVKDVIKSDILSTIGTGDHETAASTNILFTESVGSMTAFTVVDSTLFNVGDSVVITDTINYNNVFIVDTIEPAFNRILIDTTYVDEDTQGAASTVYSTDITSSISSVASYEGNAELFLADVTTINVGDTVVVNGSDMYNGTFEVLHVTASSIVIDFHYLGTANGVVASSYTQTDVKPFSSIVDHSSGSGNVSINLGSGITNFVTGNQVLIENTDYYDGMYEILSISSTIMEINCPHDVIGETGIMSSSSISMITPTVDINIYNTEWLTVEDYNQLLAERRINRLACNTDVINYYEAWRESQKDVRALNTKIEALESIIIAHNGI